jgi:hypothetical protein
MATTCETKAIQMKARNFVPYPGTRVRKTFFNTTHFTASKNTGAKDSRKEHTIYKLDQDQKSKELICLIKKQRQQPSLFNLHTHLCQENSTVLKIVKKENKT